MDPAQMQERINQLESALKKIKEWADQDIFWDDHYFINYTNTAKIAEAAAAALAGKAEE